MGDRERGRRRVWSGLAALLLSGAVAACGGGSGSGSAPGPLLPGAPSLRKPSVAPAASINPPQGFDVSHPQCARTLPGSGGFGIVGVTGGKPLTTNPCFARQLRWARGRGAYAVYVNTSYPRHTDPATWGRATVRDAVARERAAGIGGVAMWWLDVETLNSWVGTQRENATVLDAAAATLQQLGARVGIYSSPAMWAQIAGAWAPSLPSWLARGPGTAADALAACEGRGLTGGRPALAQWVQRTRHGVLDHNLICPAMRSHVRDILIVR
jgi:hypothetical protein